MYNMFSPRSQNADGSDEDDEGIALMIKPGTSTGKEEKENEVFFKKVKPQMPSNPYSCRLTVVQI